MDRDSGFTSASGPVCSEVNSLLYGAGERLQRREVSGSGTCFVWFVESDSDLIKQSLDGRDCC